MKKALVSKRGFMNVEIFYDASIEIEVPDEIDHDNLEEFLDKDENVKLKEEFDNAFNKEIQRIHSKLKTADLDYNENGGYDEIYVDEF
jgi:hypothetical protein